MTAPAKVDPMSGTGVFPQLQDAFSHRFAVSEYPCLKTFQANSHLCLRLFIPQGLEPLGDGFVTAWRLVSEDLEHDGNVAYKLLKIN